MKINSCNNIMMGMILPFILIILFAILFVKGINKIISETIYTYEITKPDKTKVEIKAGWCFIDKGFAYCGTGPFEYSKERSDYSVQAIEVRRLK